MSYASNDKSVSSGEPFECYEFIAAHKTWLFTSEPEPKLLAGKLFLPLAITRTAEEIGSIIDSPTTVDFNVPSDHEIAQTFCHTISPKGLDVKVYRAHRSDDLSVDYRIEWWGELLGAAGSGKWSTLKTGNKLQGKLNGNISSVYYQKSCNHVLFDERCKMDREDFTTTATVTKVQGQIITVDDDNNPDSELVGGEMRNVRTGEAQSIISNDLNILRVGYRFFDIVVGDTVELTLGCDHLRLGHCKNRFDNVVNYGGFDFVPEVNPFRELSYESRSSTDVTVRQNKVYNYITYTESSRRV